MTKYHTVEHAKGHLSGLRIRHDTLASALASAKAAVARGVADWVNVIRTDNLGRRYCVGHFEANE